MESYTHREKQSENRKNENEKKERTYDVKSQVNTEREYNKSAVAMGEKTT